MAIYTIDGIDLKEKYGIRVSKVSGIHDLPKRKGDISRNWLDSNGETAFVDASDIFTQWRDIILHCYVVASSEENLKTQLSDFRQKLIAQGLRTLRTPHLSSEIQVYHRSGFVFNRITKFGEGNIVGKLSVKLREPHPRIIEGAPFPSIISGNGINFNTRLRGYFPFNKDAKDYSEFITPGIVIGNLLQRTGNINVKVGGGALTFSNNNCLNITNTLPHLRNTNEGTFELWLKPDVLGNNTFIAFSETNGDSAIDFSTHITGKLYFKVQKGSEQYIFATVEEVLLNDTWTYIVLTKRGDLQRIYINGVNVPISYFYTQGANIRSVWFNNNPEIDNGRVGCILRQSQSTNFFTGVMDEIKLYDIALSSNEVLDRYNSPEKYMNKFHIDDIFTASSKIAITSGNPDATYIYTTNGDDPTSTHGTIYTEPFDLGSSSVIKAISIYKDDISKIAKEVFVI